MSSKPSHLPQSAFEQLRNNRLNRTTRPFLARGAKVARCQRCQLRPNHCLCPLRKGTQSSIDFVLLLHTNEILKPSNTGRLIADCFPDNTYALEWNRCHPCATSQSLLNDHNRQSVILFPATKQASNQRIRPHWQDPTRESILKAASNSLKKAPKKDKTIPVGSENESLKKENEFLKINNEPLDIDKELLEKEKAPAREQTLGSKKKLTVWLLDGTWRQASKMYRQSHWLASLPSMAFTPDTQADYELRQASEKSQLSTAEAAILVLNRWQLKKEAQHLNNYFSHFNQRYQDMRANRCC